MKKTEEVLSGMKKILAVLVALVILMTSGSAFALRTEPIDSPSMTHVIKQYDLHTYEQFLTDAYGSTILIIAALCDVAIGTQYDSVCITTPDEIAVVFGPNRLAEELNSVEVCFMTQKGVYETFSISLANETIMGSGITFNTIGEAEEYIYSLTQDEEDWCGHILGLDYMMYLNVLTQAYLSKF